MPKLSLPMEKSGPARKLSLSLNKGDKFLIKLSWDSEHDLDAHALLAHNDGSGAKINDLAQVLSTYNCKKTSRSGTLPANPDGSFNTPCGTLHHSGDSRDGKQQDVDEIITVNGNKAAMDVNEIPIFVTIHPKAAPATFAQVRSAGIRIENEQGKVLGEYQLTRDYSPFNAVQMGSLLYGPDTGWEFSAVGNGFNADFNGILGHFS